MDIATLGAGRPLALASLPGVTRLYRVQPPAPRSTSVVIGAAILAPAGLMAYRYDLPPLAVGYFAFDETTAVYETLARREARSIVLSAVRMRDLLSATLRSSGLRIADLRPHATDWPVLQSSRYSSTQALAADLHAHRYDGAVYSSAQHHAMHCLALFGPANAATSKVDSTPLFDALSSRLHASVVRAEQGAQLPVV